MLSAPCPFPLPRTQENFLSGNIINVDVRQRVSVAQADNLFHFSDPRPDRAVIRSAHKEGAPTRSTPVMVTLSTSSARASHAPAQRAHICYGRPPSPPAFRSPQNGQIERSWRSSLSPMLEVEQPPTRGGSTQGQRNGPPRVGRPVCAREVLARVPHVPALEPAQRHKPLGPERDLQHPNVLQAEVDRTSRPRRPPTSPPALVSVTGGQQIDHLHARGSVAERPGAEGRDVSEAADLGGHAPTVALSRVSAHCG